MSVFYFDAERTKHPYTGLHEYCVQLGAAIMRQLQPGESLAYYAPPDFGLRSCDNARWMAQRKMHRIWLPRQRDASVWHCTYQQSRYVPRWHVPKILTVHDLNFVYERRSARSVERNRKRLQDNIDRVDVLVAISQFVADDVKRHMETRGMPIAVIYNGCDVDFEASFDRPKYRPQRPFLFTIGPTVPKKNFHVLPCLLRNNDLELVIAGAARHPYLQSILAEAQRHGVTDRVKIVGNVSHEEKFWYYRHCEAFVFPSIAEGFGFPVIEAMRFSKPVFLSRLTSLPEIARDFAWYFDSFDPDSMCAVFERGMGQPLSPSRKQAIAEHAASFSWDRSAQEYLSLYRSIAQR